MKKVGKEAIKKTRGKEKAEKRQKNKGKKGREKGNTKNDYNNETETEEEEEVHRAFAYSAKHNQDVDIREECQTARCRRLRCKSLTVEKHGLERERKGDAVSGTPQKGEGVEKRRRVMVA